MTDGAGVERIGAAHLADWALARGRSAMTTQEVAGALGVPTGQVSERLAAPRSRSEWVSPTRGLWIPVPSEFRTWGAPPGIEIIDLLARHLGIDYYVGWLSAAQIHGAAHHAPQLFQVAISRDVRDRTVGRTRFDFHRRADVDKVPVVEHPTRAGHARVSTPEATALDVARDVMVAGGIDNAATVMLELEEMHALDRDELVRLAATAPAVVLRRLGYVLDRIGARPDLTALRAFARTGAATPARFDPSAAAIGPVDQEWLVRVNRELEVDW